MTISNALEGAVTALHAFAWSRPMIILRLALVVVGWLKYDLGRLEREAVA